MKKFNIQKEIRQEAENNTPDVLNRVKHTAQAQGLLKEKSTANNVQTTSRKRLTFTGLFAAVAAVVLCLAIVLPITLRPNLPSNITMSAKDAYGLGAVSTAKLLGSNVSAKAMARLSATTKNTAKRTNVSAQNDELKTSLERFNEYFVALDSFLGEELITTTTVKNTNEKYPYETMMTVKGKDVNGTDVAYVMYYSETVVKSEIDEDEQETEYSLEGIMVIDGVDYYLEGERTEESEKDEQENELKIKAYLDKNNRETYIQMEQEQSQEDNERELEYVYSVYQEGKLVEKTSVEFETERKGANEEVEYELEFLQGNAKGKYKLEREIKNGTTQIKVKYDIDGKQGEFKIRETVNNGEKDYEYIFDNK